MTELPAGTGTDGTAVTMLGYGAMELRGAPRGRDVEEQAATTLHAVLDAGINYTRLWRFAASRWLTRSA
jgi:aryl-alcohol dehydrogenase-like predicted oxidoreductase